MLSVASLGFVNGAFAEGASKEQALTADPQMNTAPHSSASTFTQVQLEEIKKTIADYLTNNPSAVMAAFQTGMALQQKEEIAKIEKAVAENKDKIFKSTTAPIAGNPQGSQSLVVFTDPNCGHCKHLASELDTLLKTNKDLKIIFKDITIMGPSSIMATKAMLAAKEQGKYNEVKKAIYASKKPLSKKFLHKLITSLGLDTKKFEADMKSKGIQDQMDQALNLSKAIGLTGTPLLIINETQVVPGYLSAEELKTKLKENSDPAASEKDKPKGAVAS